MGGTPKLALTLCALLSLCACWYSDGVPQEAPVKKADAVEHDHAAPVPKEPRKGLVGNWHDSQTGDWVQFVNVHGGIVVFTVLGVDQTGADLRVDNYTLDGTRESTDRRRVDTTEYFVPRRVQRFSPVEVRFELPADGHTLTCDRHLVIARNQGEIAETLMCPEVRAGGIVFMRRGARTYFVLLDFGGIGTRPRKKWDPAFIRELCTRYDRPFGEDVPLQEDPPEGEPPEPPED